MSRRTRWIALAGLLLGVALGALLATRLLLPTDAPRDRGAGPPRGEGTVVWAVGDGPDGGDDARAVADLIKRGAPDRVLYLGDIYSDGTEEDFEEDYEPLYGPLDPITMPTPGNHEWENRDEGYDAYWEQNGRTVNDHWYSTSVEGWQLISLNSEEEDLAPDSEQLVWLRAQVARPGNCRLAFWHTPRYNAGGNHGDDEDIEPFWDALEGKAALVVNAHEHSMQRLSEREGITTLISGAGGHSHYEVDRDYDGLAFANDTDYGALRIVLRPGRADFSFVAVGGRVLDSGTVPCRS